MRSTFLNIDLVLFSQYYGVSLLSARSCQSVIFVRQGKLEAWCAKKKNTATTVTTADRETKPQNENETNDWLKGERNLGQKEHQRIAK